MEIFQKYRLVITAYWNNSGSLWSLLFICFSLSSVAQPTGEGLQRFNEQFFEAQNLKLRGEESQAQEIFEKLYAADTSNATICYELAQLYAGDEAFERALYFAEKAARLKPQNKWYALLQVALYKQNGLPKKQIPIYRRLIRLEPRNTDLRLELAEAFYRLSENKAALAQLDSVEQITGLNEQITELKKDIYLANGDLKGAAAELQNLIDAYPNELQYRGALGQLYFANGQMKKALKVYQKMVAIDSTDPRPQLDLANYYQSVDDFERSLYHLKKALGSPLMEVDQKVAILLSLFEASAKDSDLRIEVYDVLEQIVMKPGIKDPRVYALYGDYLSRDGRDSEALQYYLKAVRHPQGQKFQVWEQIMLIEVQNRRFDSLAAHSQEALASFPNQPLPYLMGGLALNALEQHQEAADLLDEGQIYALGNARLKEELFLQLAEAYHRLDQHAESDKYFDKALILNSENVTTLNNYAYYLSLRGEKLDKALRMTELSNELSPANPTFLDTYAWVLYQMERYREAEEIMAKLFKLQPDPPGEVWEHYGDILAARAKGEAARIAYRKALAKGEPAEQLQQKIDKLP